MESLTLLPFRDAIIRNSYNDLEEYKVGDIVKLKNGEAAQKVVEVQGHCIRCEYVSSRKQIGYRSVSDFTYYQNNVPDEANNINIPDIDNNKKEYDMKDKLFKTLTDNRFGTGLAIDSDCNYVLKMQDTGNFESFDSTTLKRVMPYTFDVEFLGEKNSRQSVYSYRGREGQVVVGDLLLLNGSLSIARVVAVNTESESATKPFDGVKLVTEAI